MKYILINVPSGTPFKFKSIDDYSECERIATVDKEIFIFENISIGGKNYSPRSIHRFGEVVFVNVYEVELSDETKTDFEDCITCPVCGYEDGDSWESEDDSDDYECGRCGATLRIHRNVSVSYDAELVKKNEPVSYDEFLTKEQK
jgi:Zn ribbon nucleic-acid-binding protein